MGASNNYSNTSLMHHCYYPMHTVSSGILQGDSPLRFALPLLTIQISLVLLATRTIAFVFKPIKQPRVLAEIIGGVLLGPTALGRNKVYMDKIFPEQSLPLLETVATMGLMFFIFMVGLELDVNALRKMGKGVLLVAGAGIVVPFSASAGLSAIVMKSSIGKDGGGLAPLIMFMGIPLSMSAFSVLMRIMAEIKLLRTEVGKVVVPAAAMNDVMIWILLAIGVAMSPVNGHASGDNTSIIGQLRPLWVIMSGVGFGVVMMTLVRKVMIWVASRAIKEREGGEIYVCGTMLGVLLAGFCSDALGVHSLLGPFLLGLVIPKDRDSSFAHLMTHKLEDFVTGLLLPLFFASSGLKTNLAVLHGVESIGFLLLFTATAAIGKVGATFVSARLLMRLPPRKAIILGFLMNTKGLGVLIVLNIGRDVKALTDQTFAILMITCLLTTILTTPIVKALCKQQKAESNEYSIEHKPSTQQLRILACTYDTTDYAILMNFLEASRGELNKKPLKVYTLNLMELTDRRSDIVFLTSNQSASMGDSTNKTTLHNQMLINLAFHSSPKLSKVDVTSLTTISKVDTMHDDVCNLARAKRATIILLPHDIQSPDNHEFDNSHRILNEKVLDRAPCSIGIIAKVGVTLPIHPCFFSFKVVVLFMGGIDDREALTFGCRMMYHPGVLLKVIRLVFNPKSSCDFVSCDIDTNEKALDEETIMKVKEKALEHPSLLYEDQHIGNCGQNNFVESIGAIIKVLDNDVNMFIIGRRRFDIKHNEAIGPLGTIGDILVTQLKLHTCVLVVQNNQAQIKN